MKQEWDQSHVLGFEKTTAPFQIFPQFEIVLLGTSELQWGFRAASASSGMVFLAQVSQHIPELPSWI